MFGRCGIGIWAAIALTGASGCVSGLRLTAEPPPAVETSDAIVFFLDGAGGGGPVIDAAPEVLLGLRLGGYDGAFRSVRWQTGLGAIADLTLSVPEKRALSVSLAARIQEARELRPDARISLISASTGTAIAVYALELLPPGVRIDNLVLLSSALSADYDLSPALKHVVGGALNFVSNKDALLQAMIPLFGSADRKLVGSRVAGVVGFETVDSAAQMNFRTLSWTPEMRRSGHYGGHTDYKNATFIAQVIAPWITR
jgi:pimeloyl-ACP methyl ester carboxylesterase